MISPQVREFLTDYIDSAELLDVLMLLVREPDKAWTPDTVSNRVFSVPQAAQQRLDELTVRGLVAERADTPGSYALSVRDDKLAETLAEVRQVYERNRADLITFVFSMKADPVKSFSNAFKLRRDR